ncbi:MAG: dimethylargininase, partial [Jiangellaceae bacterium]
MYPEAVICIEDDALVLGLNFVSDGRDVVIASQAEKLAAGIEEAGFGVVPVDVSELLKAGGGIKCTTQELHAWPTIEEVTA